MAPATSASATSPHTPRLQTVLARLHLAPARLRPPPLPVPIDGIISDGQQPLRKAVGSMLPDVAHQLCQFHYLREAAKPVFEADRHVKKELKKQLRGVRPIERALEGRKDP